MAVIHDRRLDVAHGYCEEHKQETYSCSCAIHHVQPNQERKKHHCQRAARMIWDIDCVIFREKKSPDEKQQRSHANNRACAKSFPFVTIILRIDLRNQNHNMLRRFTSVLLHKFHNRPMRHTTPKDIRRWDDWAGKVLARFHFLELCFDDIKEFLFQPRFPQIHL